MIMTRLQLSAISLVLLTVSCAGAVEIKLHVSEIDRMARTPAVVTTGVPFAKGTVTDVSSLSVSVDGKAIPAQFSKLAVWEDGSVRWALLDSQLDVPPGGRRTLLLRNDGKNVPPASPVKVAESAGEVRLTTGALEAVIDKRKAGLFRSLKVAGQELLLSGGRGLVLYAPGEARTVTRKQRGRPVKVTEYGPPRPVPAGPPEEVTVEHAGPLRAVVRLRGRFPGVHQGRVGYTVRVSAFAGQRFIKLHVWLENHGGMGYYRRSRRRTTTGNMEWLLFDGMAVELGLGLGRPVRASCEGAGAPGRFKVLQVCKLNKNNRKLQYNNYKVYTLEDFEFTVTAGAKQLKKGERTDGVVELSGPGGKLTAAIRDFWENYEKAIELDGPTLKLWLWPLGGQWPRVRPWRYAGLFDKQLESCPRPGFYYLPGSVHKGHELILDFSGRGAHETLADLSRPLFALAAPEHYASTEAAPGLFAPPAVRTGTAECDTKLDAWVRMTRTVADPRSKTGFLQARKQSEWSAVTYFGDSTYWYGWMDFGDISVPGRGPVSLSGDWLWIALLGALRTGDVNFMRLAAQMARHRIDVDQFWSDRDPPEVRGLQRGSLNFPAFHCYRLYRPPDVRTNHLAGVALYYMLTGEPKALECCRRNAEGLKVAWTYVARTKPWAGPQGDMAANASGIHAYCAMYGLTGDRKWLQEALGLFRTNVCAKWKALGPHLHERRQIRSQDYTRDDIKYCSALASFCLLHHLTGDRQLLKLLRAGCDKDFPENFFDAPLFLADLHAYVALRTNKADYAEDAVEHWIQAFPESKCPPVFLPGNSQWSRSSARTLRAGHLLQYYFWKRPEK